MIKFFLLITFLFSVQLVYSQNNGYINLSVAKFSTGDISDWKSPAFNDSQWKDIKVGEVWQNQGYPDYHGYAWYRIHVTIPSSLKQRAVWGDSLRVFLAHVNDADETYLNGTLIGKIGAFPNDQGGYVSKWPAIRYYSVAAGSAAIKWDAENIIAIKVFDGGGSGGIFMGSPFIDMLEKFDGIAFNLSSIEFLPGRKAERQLIVSNKFNTTISGVFHYQVIDELKNMIIEDKTIPASLAAYSGKAFTITFPHREGIKLIYDFKESASGKIQSYTEIAPYILTPGESLKPVINSAAVLGVHAGSQIIYKIPASGKKPLTYNVGKLPAGLNLDTKTGIITGSIPKNGSYHLGITVINSLGKDKKLFTIKVGNQLALTPPMGWNSWNCWGLSVSAEKVKSSAQAMIDQGLTDYGWNYINVDDGWQAAKRLSSGELIPNEKFPDMAALGRQLHREGLKFGIYSSPGAKTCGGFLGSLGYEAIDAKTYYNWGVDYLKYDLCSYTDNTAGDTTLFAQQKPYMVMRDELKKQPRDIIYSICQYGIHDVWKWGKQMNGNLWRTTEDITDTWESLYSIGFSQTNNAAYAHPGGWNDPDMLIVGMVGWGESLHPSNLTPYEQYTHISLWSLLSAPLLIGCDMSKLDKFTLSLLKNREVIAIDQDELGVQAKRILNDKNIQVWLKPLADGGLAVGIFNMSEKYKSYKLPLNTIGIDKAVAVRDVWKQENIARAAHTIAFNIPPHGVRLIKIIKGR